MKHPTHQHPLSTLRWLQVIVLALTMAAPNLFAASQTWTNAPVSQYWTNVNNWVAKAVPGALNLTGNTVNNDTATFNSPIPLSGYGGAASPITPDDATIANDRSRQIGSILFDTTNCGAYVFSSPSPAALGTVSTPETGILNLSHNGSITLNPTVTNNQTFLVPLYTRLPSSTAGIYNFVNNSTNGAILYIDSAVNDSANSRGTVFVLDGSNTGTNTVRYLSAGTTTTGGNGLTKQGTGTWILPVANDFRSQTVVSIKGGTLIVKDPAAFENANSVNVTVTNATLQIESVTLDQASVNLQNGGNIRMNGTSSLNGVALGTQPGTIGTLSTTSASDVFTVGTQSGFFGGTALVTGGAADTVLNTAGPGTLVFNRPNTYIGKWSFNAATNQLGDASALGTGANANVGAGATLDLTALGTFAPTTSGFGGSGTGTSVGSTAAAVMMGSGSALNLTGKNINLTFTPTASSGDLTHPALYISQGSLTLGNNTFFVNNAFGTPLGVGTYRLIQQASGSVTPGGNYAVVMSGSGLASGTAAAIQVSGGNVDLVVAVYVPQNLVWTGNGGNSNWNVGTDANWWNGSTHVVFNNSDVVTFNSFGSSNPVVALSGTLAPASVTVDASANDYTFSGSGQIGSTADLKKIGSGALILQTANTYAGGTTVSNGTLRLGAHNAVSSTGTGDVKVYAPGVFDLNGFTNTINGLIGDGTVDVKNGGTSVITLGNNDKTGTFSGVLKNTSGTLAVAKIGLGTETLSGANTYSGSTTINGGTLQAANGNALGSGSSAVTVNSGTLDVATNLNILSLDGTGGTIANNTTATTNRLTIVGSATTTFAGSIANGSGGGAMALTVMGGSLTMNGNNTYSGGTIVASGATFLINNSPAAVGGFVIASNGASVGFAGGSGTPGTPTSITTVDGGTVTFPAQAEGKVWNCGFFGSANTTNVFNGPQSAGGSLSFSNFFGLVRINATNQNFRFFNGGGTSGGPDTTFEFQFGSVHTRDAQTVILGSVVGGSPTAGISGGGAGVLDTWILGTKGVDNVFHGYISGSNNLVKAGSAKLVLDGMTITTNTDNTTYTNYLYSPLMAYTGATTVSNGVLSLVVPNNYSNSTSITLATPSAVLDARSMGYISNQISGNQILVTNGVLELFAGQSLWGVGTVWGALQADAGTTVNAGLQTGTLTITNGVNLQSATVNMNLNRTNSSNASQIAASGSTTITVNGATLNVTNLGPDLVTGDVYHLFNKAVTGTGFTTITLPKSNALNTIEYLYQTNLTTDGSITVLQGASAVATNPTNITVNVSGNTLQLTWPGDHLGWTLLTNAVGLTETNSWFPVPNSATVTNANINIDTTKTNVFFRLVYPYP